MRWILLLTIISSFAVSSEPAGAEERLNYLGIYRPAKVHSLLFIRNCAEFFKEEMAKTGPRPNICGGDQEPKTIPAYADIYPAYGGEEYAKSIVAFDENLERIPSEDVVANTNGARDRVRVEWMRVYYEYYDHVQDKIISDEAWISRTAPGVQANIHIVQEPARTSLEARIARWKEEFKSDPGKLLTVHSGYSFEEMYPDGNYPPATKENGGIAPGGDPAKGVSGDTSNLSWIERTFFSEERQQEIAENRRRRLAAQAEMSKYVVTGPMGGALTLEGWRVVGSSAWQGIKDSTAALVGSGDEEPGEAPEGVAETEGDVAKTLRTEEPLGRKEPEPEVVADDGANDAVVASPDAGTPDRAKGAWERQIPPKFQSNRLAEYFYGLPPIEFRMRVCSLSRPSVAGQLEEFLKGQGNVLHEFMRDSLAQEISGRCIKWEDVRSDRAAYALKRMQALLTTDDGRRKFQEIMDEIASVPAGNQRQVAIELMNDYVLEGGMPYVPYRDSKPYEQYIMGDFEQRKEEIEAKIAKLGGRVECLGRPINLRDLRTIDGLARVMWGEGRGCERRGAGHYHVFAKVMDDRVQMTLSDTDKFRGRDYGSYVHDMEALRTEPGFFSRIVNESSLNRHQQFDFTRSVSPGERGFETITSMSEVEKIFSRPGQFSVLNARNYEESIRDVVGRGHFGAGGDLAALAGPRGLASVVNADPAVLRRMGDIFTKFTVNLPRPKKYMREILEVGCNDNPHEKALFAKAVNLATEMVCDPAKFREDYKYDFHYEDNPDRPVYVTNSDPAIGRHRLDWLLFYSHGFEFKGKRKDGSSPPGRRWDCYRWKDKVCQRWVRSIKPGMRPDNVDVEIDLHGFGALQDYRYERQPQGSPCPEPHYWYPAN